MIAVGWREWVSIPDWGLDVTKAKIDTGARTSAIHAADQELFERDGERWVRFVLHPWQRTNDDPVTVEAPRIDHRTITSSSGTKSERPVVSVGLRMADVEFETELTLTTRHGMGFRMLVGRQALAGRFVVDSAASYLGGRPPREVRRRNRGKA